MEIKLPCAIVQDLLPSYADGITSQETAELLAVHLDNCEPCRRMYEEMAAPQPIPPEESAEVDYLKKINADTQRKSWRNGTVIALGLLAALFIVALTWRLWPRELGSVVSLDAMTVSAYAGELALNADNAYVINRQQQDDALYAPLVALLQEMDLRPDFRTALFGVSSLGSTDAYDGRTVWVQLNYTPDASRHSFISFIDWETVGISNSDWDGYHIYHLVGDDFDALYDFVQQNGTTP